jgi:uncharacterized iron-regulated protein
MAPGGGTLRPAGIGFAALIVAIVFIVILGFAVARHQQALALAAEQAALAAEAEQADRIMDHPEDSHLSHQTLSERLEAAETIVGSNNRSAALAIVATDAGKAGQGEIVKLAVSKIADSSAHDQAALDAARLLGKGGRRKQAIEVAKLIYNNSVRDQAFSELAR